MSAIIEAVSKQMFDWFVKNSTCHIPKLFENNNVRNIAWEMCASGIREIFEEGLRVPHIFVDTDSDAFDLYYESLTSISYKFYDVVEGVIWDNRGEIHDDRLFDKFEECLDSIRAN